MLTLLLLRHAKSDWDNPKLSDFERPLARRGREAAPRMARYMSKSEAAPDRVLCSSAVRTRQTWDLVAPHLKTAPAAAFEDKLYLATPDTLLRLIRETPKACQTLLVVGHNPGLEELAVGLCRSTRANPLQRALASKFPTCALARLTFSKATWKTVALGTGQLIDFMTPKKLET
jgi:phosphohistidine phosphatase